MLSATKTSPNMVGRQTEMEMLENDRKRVGYGELFEAENKADVDMVDVVDGQVDEEEEVAAEVLSRLSISRQESVPRARRILGRPRRVGNRFKVANDSVHHRIRLHDPDKMADDRRGGGGGYNRKRRFNRGMAALRILVSSDRD